MKNTFRYRLVRCLLFVASAITTTFLLSNGGTKAADLGPGQLDPTFGNSGKIIGQGGSAIALQPDGNSIPVVPGVAMDIKRYDWMGGLAKADFDVFAMDHTGYGFSPRPKMDDPCNITAVKLPILIPDPLPAPCEPGYPSARRSARASGMRLTLYIVFLRVSAASNASI